MAPDDRESHPVATDTLSRAFAALADPTRRDLVVRLVHDDAPLATLAAEHDMSTQAISKHLGVLEDAGIVSRTTVGRRRPVTVETAAVDEVTGWLTALRARMDARYRRLDAVLQALADDDHTDDDPPDRAP